MLQNYIIYNGELYHWGIKGMKWGQRRYQNADGSLTPAGKKRYTSTSLKATMARRANEKVDEGFKNWDENAKKRDNAIELGKKATAAKRAYENDKTNPELKSAYKQANKDYKKALGENTTYRKGVVRKEVGQDAARKYLSDAKKVKKQLDADPTNKDLQRKYNELMSKHDIERANARRATQVSTKRMNKERSIKSKLTTAVKATATTAAVGVGIAAANKYLLNGKLNVSPDQIINLAKKGRDMMGYFY